VFYAVLAVLLGIFVNVLEDPPTEVTAIIVATGFGVLIANEVSLRRHGSSDRSALGDARGRVPPPPAV
jgi:hypothetical protein